MKKSELKNIIKECVKEVIFEEGVLSGIITEVVKGVSTGQPITERQAKSAPSQQRSESRRQVLAAVGKNSYDEIKNKFADPSLFEGTVPIPSESGKGALSNVAAGDQGLDISNLPGFGNWGAVVKNLG